MKAPLVVVYDYSSYRELLADLYVKRRAQDSQVSMEVVGKNLGWSDFSYFSKVLSGKRKLPLKKMSLVSKYFKLHGAQGTFFENLVRWNDFNDHKSERVCRQLKEKAKKQIVRNMNPENETEFYEFVIVRMALRRFNNALTKEELKKILVQEFPSGALSVILDRMVAHGVINLKEEIYSVPNEVLRSHNEVSSRSLRFYHRKMLYKAIQAIESQFEDRQFAGRTVCLSKSALPEFKAAVLEAIDQIVDKFSDEKADDKNLYHMHFTAFSLENIFARNNEDAD